MKTTLLVLVLMPALCLAENLFRNSDMDARTSWVGDRDFESVDGNRVLSLEAKKNKTVMFSQEVDTKDIKDLVLKFRYRSADHNGRGLQIRGKRQDGSSTFRDIDLKSDDQWHKCKWDFSEVRGSREIQFSFELLESAGKVVIDDVTVEPKA